ncbi:unnamed protein product, partial [Discosporangium mesarthrocarpum]
MVDFTQFAQDDFDVKAWVNSAIASYDGGEDGGAVEQPGGKAMLATGVPGAKSLDNHISTLATKLQSMSSGVNGDLENSMVEVMVAVPRVIMEVQQMEASIKRLSEELENLTGQLEEIDHGTNSHVETLACLDLVKGNMEECMHTLTEAASWNALVRDVNTRFSQGDLSGVAGQLESMRRSLEVLKLMPEADDRARTLRGFQERLEALLKPKLQQALKNDRVGPLTVFVHMYRQLGRVQELREEYARARPATTHKRWFANASAVSSNSAAALSSSSSSGAGARAGAR